MKKTVIKFGVYAALVGGTFFIGSHFFDWNMEFDLLEVFGYASILASLSFVFFGIKHFRYKTNNGLVTFKKALLIGLAISAIAGLSIGILDIIYVTVINPDFVSEYSQYALEGMKNTLSPDEFETPLLSGLFMFAIVFTIGIIVSLISALILQRK